MTEFLQFLPILLFSVVAHEFAHAWVAYRQGDDTALKAGRLTLNPLPHIDPMMSVIMPALIWYLSGYKFTFGAARPVPIDVGKFRHPRRGDILVSLAGITANLIIALGCAGAFVLAGMLAAQAPATGGALSALQRFLLLGLQLNLFLAFFNLLPIPPLDGSHVLYHLLPARWGAKYRALGPIGMLVIIGTLMVPGLWQQLMWPLGVVNNAAGTALQGYAIP